MIDDYIYSENYDFNLDKSKSVAFTGHREVKQDFNQSKFKVFLQELINKGYQNFYVGMAVGFDTICFKTLQKLKSKNDIKIIACIPCMEQDKKYTYLQKQEYQKMVKCANQKVIISKTYTPYCMQQRNMFMVDNSSLLVSYMYKNSGGTANTVNYAKRCGIKVINVSDIA